MANDVIAPPAPGLNAPKPAADDLGLDREFLMSMARMPLLAIGWVALSILAHYIWGAFAPEGTINYAPVVVICAGMILAAVVDGWAYKVPNWVTMPLVLSGWMIGLLHDLDCTWVDAGTGSFQNAFWGTFVGFALLFPILAIGGVGAGDVKMQMGFGAWVGAYFGNGEATGGLHWGNVLVWSFACGAIAGGIFGMAMILLRGKFRQNATMVSEIFVDLQMFMSGQGTQASKRATDRRQKWVKLPYGIPLCVGFLFYLWYVLILN
jgi:prepilin peptidase CpaA